MASQRKYIFTCLTKKCRQYSEQSNFHSSVSPCQISVGRLSYIASCHITKWKQKVHFLSLCSLMLVGQTTQDLAVSAALPKICRCAHCLATMITAWHHGNCIRASFFLPAKFPCGQEDSGKSENLRPRQASLFGALDPYQRL